MSNTINILTVVDCQSIMEAVAKGKIKQGTQSNPTNLGSYSTSDLYIYMLANLSYVISEQGKSELKVAANVGDTVRWVTTCIGEGIDYNTILQNIKPNAGAPIAKLGSDPLNVNLYVGPPGGPNAPIFFKDYCFDGIVNGVGTVQYVVTFQIVDNHGKDLGYYCWDPFIQVSN